MIIALSALSIAMIVGGVASVIQGFPFVRLESGLAMTIAGATTASAGAVVLGLSILTGQVRRLGRQLAETAFMGPAASPTVPPGASLPREHVSQTALPDQGPVDPKLQASRRPVIAGPAELAAGAVGAASLGTADIRGRPEPTFEEPPASTPSPVEPLLPDLLPPRDDAPAAVHDGAKDGSHDDLSRDVTAQAPSPALAEVEPSDADLFASSAPPALRPAIGEASAEAELLEPAPAEPALEVVGTYVSGGNTYVMFSDGSIEAETPRGRFTFESLEELKAFVEAGGEGETRGVA